VHPAQVLHSQPAIVLHPLDDHAQLVLVRRELERMVASAAREMGDDVPGGVLPDAGRERLQVPLDYSVHFPLASRRGVRFT